MWSGLFDVRGNRGYFGLVGGVSRGLIDVIRVLDRLGFIVKSG